MLHKSREDQNTHLMFTNFFFFEKRAVYEIMWKKCGKAGQATDDNRIRRMRFACRITKVWLQTHTESIKYILFFPLPHWLCQRAPLLP